MSNRAKAIAAALLLLALAILSVIWSLIAATHWMTY